MKKKKKNEKKKGTDSRCENISLKFFFIREKDGVATISICNIRFERDKYSCLHGWVRTHFKA